MSTNAQHGMNTYKNARRNSEQIRRIQTFWGPLFDHFLGVYNFLKIGVPGSIPHVFSFLGVSGWAEGFFRRKIDLSQIYIRVSRIFIIF